MTLQLLHSQFPYIWGKFYFLFYQCSLKLTAASFIWGNNILFQCPNLIKLDWHCCRKTYIALYTHILNASSPPPPPLSHQNIWIDGPILHLEILCLSKKISSCSSSSSSSGPHCTSDKYFISNCLIQRDGTGRVENWPLSAVRVLNYRVLTKITVLCTGSGAALLRFCRAPPAKMCGQNADKGQHAILWPLWSYPCSCMYINDWPMPTVCDFGHVCVHLVILIYQQLKQLQLPEALSWAALLGPAVRYVMSSGKTRLSQYKLSPLHPSPPDKLGSTPCWVSSLRPSASVSYLWSQW